MIKRLLSICILLSGFSFSAIAQQSSVAKVTAADFDAMVLKSKTPVVVHFDAGWCGPCRMIAPALNDIAGDMGARVRILELNVDDSPDLAKKYGIMSIPVLIIFKNGAVSSKQVGAAPKSKLEQWISANAGS
jgi:thioredoxin 1